MNTQLYSKVKCPFTYLNQLLICLSSEVETAVTCGPPVSTGPIVPDICLSMLRSLSPPGTAKYFPLNHIDTKFPMILAGDERHWLLKPQVGSSEPSQFPIVRPSSVRIPFPCALNRCPSQTQLWSIDISQELILTSKKIVSPSMLLAMPSPVVWQGK